MPVPKVNFDPPYDVHLLHGQSFELDYVLDVAGTRASVYIGAHAGLSVTYEATYKGVVNGDNYEGSNISLHTTDGTVTADAAAPAADHVVNNFIVIATVSHTDGTSKKARIRIHIHESITSVWLSPETLTIQKGVMDYRVTVRARFNDDVVGVIGNVHRHNNTIVDYHYNPAYRFDWTCSEPTLVNADGEINPAPAVVGDPDPASGMNSVPKELHIRVRILAFDDTVTDGRIVVSDDLTVASTQTVELVSGPGFPKINEVPNILFVGDGYTAGDDATKFSTMVHNMVNELNTGKISSPFDKLSTSINYWMICLPSREKGVNTRQEIYLKDSGSGPKGHYLPRPMEPTVGINARYWRLSNLIYHCGLPVRGQENISDNDLETLWQNTTKLSNAQITDIKNNSNLMTYWRQRAQRRLPEARDTALRIMINDYTSVDTDSDHRDLSFYPFGLTRTSIDDFIAGLEDSSGNNVGAVFKKSAPQGKDFDRIAFLSAGISGRENNFYGGFFTLLNTDADDEGIPVDGTIAGFKTSIVPPNNIENMPFEAKGSMMHELGHSFYLGDEYGEWKSGTHNLYTDHADVVGWNRNQYSDPGNNLDKYGNIIARSDILTGANIDPLKLKWRYHRIQKVGIVTAPPVDAGGNIYTVTLESADQANAFEENDVVFLRKSDKDTPIRKIDRSNPADIKFSLSQELAVVAGHPAPNQIKVRSTDLSNSSLQADFTNAIVAGERIIVYTPVEKPDSATSPFYHHAEVISEKVLSHLVSNPWVFNIDPADATHKERIDQNNVQNTFIPGALIPSCSSQKHKIVGMYSGGKAYHCHVYHGTARCTMRWHVDEQAVEKFCEVCKYTIVDYINPTKHPELDEEIGCKKIYPK